MARWGLPPDLHKRTYGGPVCPFAEHSIGCRDGLIPRYDDSHACTRCVAALSEGRLSLDIKRIHRRHRRRFLEFWSLVQLDEPDACWPWMGLAHSRTGSSYFHFPRHWSNSRQFSAPRVATWFTWGDIGRLPIVPLCDTPNCCNPLHIRVRGVPHFYHRRKIREIDIAFSSRKLACDTSEFLQISRDVSPEDFSRIEKLNSRWIQSRLQQIEAEDRAQK